MFSYNTKKYNFLKINELKNTFFRYRTIISFLNYQNKF